MTVNKTIFMKTEKKFSFFFFFLSFRFLSSSVFLGRNGRKQKMALRKLYSINWIIIITHHLRLNGSLILETKIHIINRKDIACMAYRVWMYASERGKINFHNEFEGLWCDENENRVENFSFLLLLAFSLLLKQ